MEKLATETSKASGGKHHNENSSSQDLHPRADSSSQDLHSTADSSSQDLHPTVDSTCQDLHPTADLGIEANTGDVVEACKMFCYFVLKKRSLLREAVNLLKHGLEVITKAWTWGDY